MQRDRHDGIDRLFPRKGRDEQAGQDGTERRDALELEQMDELAERTFVGAKRIGRLETVRPGGTHQADAVFAERAGVQKRRVAAEAGVLWCKRLNGVQTARADGDAGEVIELVKTEAAGIGQQDAEHMSGQTAQTTCSLGRLTIREPWLREVPPPGASKGLTSIQQCTRTRRRPQKNGRQRLGGGKRGRAGAGGR